MMEHSVRGQSIANAVEMCEGYIAIVDDQRSKIIVYLGTNKDWLNAIKEKTKGDQTVIVISDTDEFRSFIMQNGTSKMYININMTGINGIDLAEEMKLERCFGELIFVASSKPSDADMARIDALGSKFMNKGELLEKIVYPREDS